MVSTLLMPLIVSSPIKSNAPSDFGTTFLLLNLILGNVFASNHDPSRFRSSSLLSLPVLILLTSIKTLTERLEILEGS